MRRHALTVILVIAAFVLGATAATLTAQPAGDPCDAWRTGDIVTVDLQSCVTPTSAAPSTTGPSPTAPTTSVPDTTTTATQPPAPTTEPPPTTTVAPTVPSSTTPATTSPSPSTTSTTATTSPGGGDFTATFATAADLDRFDWSISHGGIGPFPRTDQPRTWHADHDDACAAPPTLRTVGLVGAAGPGPVSVTGGLAFWCAPGNDPARGHVMTSTSLTAYGHIDFSPRQVFRDVERVCWAMNRSDLGGRKWAQVTIVPEAAFAANGGALDYVKPDLETDVAAAGPHLPVGAFQMETFRELVGFNVGDGRRTGADPGGWGLDAFGTPASDWATRYRHCLTDGPGGVTLTIERGATVYDANYGPAIHFPPGDVRVIFQDTTYDSIKGDWGRGGSPDDTNTWHWDDIVIEEAP